RILRLLVDEDPRRRSHRPGFLARLVGKNHAVAWLRVPVGIGGRSLKATGVRSHNLAVLVYHFGMGELVLLGVGILDITDCALGVGHVVSNTLITLGPNARRPLH